MQFVIADAERVEIQHWISCGIFRDVEFPLNRRLWGRIALPGDWDITSLAMSRLPVFWGGFLGILGDGTPSVVRGLSAKSPLLMAGMLILSAGAILTLWVWRRKHRAATTPLVPVEFQSALDGLAESILIVDLTGAIAFANQSFLQLTGESSATLLRQNARSLAWNWQDEPAESTDASPVPWIQAIREGKFRRGRLLGPPACQERILELKAVPIALPSRPPRGAIISFTDVTRLIRKEAESMALLQTVRESSVRIRRQNEELQQLLIQDSLTGAWNRRTGMDYLEKCWASSIDHAEPLACILIDVDNFHEMNQQLGHDQADELLRQAAGSLARELRPADGLCRFSGEEFLAILPQTGLQDAALLAERLRQAVRRVGTEYMVLTASLGVAERESRLMAPQELLAHAAERLNASQRLGGNQVTSVLPSVVAETGPALPSAVESQTVIPFPAVTALLSALAYRDLATASHSRRVADLCVALGQRLMSFRGCYLTEMAALLHDIGKIGIPDAILQKNTELTEDEWHTIQTYDRIGTEIVQAAFGSQELTHILQSYRIPFQQMQAQAGGQPLGARILAVADAYDSMVNHQIYRQAMGQSEAIAELQRCAGTQFDPEIVAAAVDLLKSRGRESGERLHVDREVSLALGMEMERLAAAVDQQDDATLKALAQHLQQTARRYQAGDILERAQELERVITEDVDRLGILQAANELLLSCRSTQSLPVLPQHSDHGILI